MSVDEIGAKLARGQLNLRSRLRINMPSRRNGTDTCDAAVRRYSTPSIASRICAPFGCWPELTTDVSKPIARWRFTIYPLRML